MMNFQKYYSMTEAVIPDLIEIPDNSLYNAFYGMGNLKSISIPNSITNISKMCYNCGWNLTTAVCGNNVTDMSWAYSSCSNLTGSPACGNKVTNMSNAYYNCRNIRGNAYFYSNNVFNVGCCFASRNTSNILNIYVHNGSKTMNTCLSNNYTSSLVGYDITWTNNSICHYNTQFNIYIYPVSNVADKRASNGD